MLDVAIRDGVVVDGTGRRGRRTDVGIVDGRIVEIGRLEQPARTVLEAGGHVVSPGFIDVHTHYDAQMFWDPTFSPSPLHGVTTVIAGNCGISLAPVNPDDEEFMAGLLSRVEAIPLEALSAGLGFKWGSFSEFLNVVESMDLMLNVGFLVGHSAVRRYVMGDAGSSAEASAESLRQMVRVLEESLASGALGFSSSRAATQFDGDGRPTPPNFAADEELIALARACGRYPGTSLEYIPESAAYGFDEKGRDLELMAAMSRSARRQINWNTILLRYPGRPDIQDLQLASADFGTSRGAVIVPMIIPHNFRVRTDFLLSDVGFRTQPGFDLLFDATVTDRIMLMMDDDVRQHLKRRLAESTGWSTVIFRDQMGDHIVSDVGRDDLKPYVGRTVGDIAAERHAEVLDVIFDLAVAANLDIGFTRNLAPVNTPDERALRRRVLRDPRLVLGASDGGAHVRGVINTEYSTASFAELVRDEAVFTVEELVQEFTDVPARLYGLRDRGRIERGAHADIVIFDPDVMSPSPVCLKHDLPGGASRLFSTGRGIDRVLVGGEVVVERGEFSERRPGQLLRSGRDTATIPRNRLLRRRRTAPEHAS